MVLRPKLNPPSNISRANSPQSLPENIAKHQNENVNPPSKMQVIPIIISLNMAVHPKNNIISATSLEYLHSLYRPAIFQRQTRWQHQPHRQPRHPPDLRRRHRQPHRPEPRPSHQQPSRPLASPPGDALRLQPSINQFCHHPHPWNRTSPPTQPAAHDANAAPHATPDTSTPATAPEPTPTPPPPTTPSIQEKTNPKGNYLPHQ